MNNQESECEEMRFLDRWKKLEMKTAKKIAMKKYTNANRESSWNMSTNPSGKSMC